MNYTFHVPLNSVSFGSVSFSLLRESFKAGHNPCIIPVGGQVDISAQKEDKEFTIWLQSCLNKGLRNHKRNTPTLKLWHLNGGMESFSNKQILYSFYELNSPTPEEINTIQNNHKVLFPCDYNTNTFKDYCENVETVPLGFDYTNFYDTKKEYFTDGRITFFIGGKWEPVRKRTEKVIQSWLKRFGNNPKYFLNCAIFNPFIQPPEQHNQIYQNITKGQRYGNIQFLGFMQQNEMYNDFLNSNDVVLGLGTESWGLPEFTSCALGKHSIISNYAGHKQWANKENSILIAPSSQIQAYDGMFFHPNQPFNQGAVYDFDENDLIKAFDDVIARVEKSRINEEGKKLQTAFTYKKTFDRIYQLLME